MADTQTYQPDLYDLVTPASFAGDVEWYVRKAKTTEGPVLELGAGTGRVTMALAREGVAVHALDAHPGMLDGLRRKLADLPADMQRVNPAANRIEAVDLSLSLGYPAAARAGRVSVDHDLRWFRGRRVRARQRRARGRRGARFLVRGRLLFQPEPRRRH